MVQLNTAVQSEVENSITFLWADTFCLQQWKNY